MYERVVIVCGMPRSGTSWLGQIFDSSYEVAFRMEPLFAYQFKNQINECSSKKQMLDFLKSVYLTDDDFILQKENRLKGSYPVFHKNKLPSILVIKTTRHHHLLKHYLEYVDNIDIVSIVRHPCAVINSWMSTEREFSAKGCKIDKDWRSGECRKGGVGEYWGFDDWLSITELHNTLSRSYGNFHIVKYKHLVADLRSTITGLFKTLSIDFGDQTLSFLEESQRTHNKDPYSVYKDVRVVGSWEKKLDPSISEIIIKETTERNLGEYLE